MGIVHIDVTIRNPADPGREWSAPFLVDTDAIDSLAPRECLEAIGLAPKGRRIYETADGRQIELDVTTGDIEFMGEVTAGRIVFGDADSEPLLGATALESAGVEVDPRNRGLTKRSSVRLKGCLPGGGRDSAHAEALSGRAVACAGRGKFRWRNMAGRAMRPSGRPAAASQGRE